MSEKMIQSAIRAEESIFKLAENIAKKEGRSKNYILYRWLINGMNMEKNDGVNTG